MLVAKGVKRKRSAEEAPPTTSTAIPSNSLFSISVSKLHQSLQHGEPNLRHLVLVANTLRRIQDEMQPARVGSPQAAPGRGPLSSHASKVSSEAHAPDALACSLQDTGWRPLPVASLTPVDDLLLSSMDVSVFSTILEGFGDSLHPSDGQPEGSHLGVPLSPEPERTSNPCPPSPLEFLGAGGYLVEDGLDGIFEDIDTSMYDCEAWSSSASLPSFKEAFSSPVAEGERELLDLADLDYLMDVLVGVQEL